MDWERVRLREAAAIAELEGGAVIGGEKFFDVGALVVDFGSDLGEGYALLVAPGLGCAL